MTGVFAVSICFMACPAFRIHALLHLFRYFIFTKFIEITNILGNRAEHPRPGELANIFYDDIDDGGGGGDDDDDGIQDCNSRDYLGAWEGFKSRMLSQPIGRTGTPCK